MTKDEEQYLDEIALSALVESPWERGMQAAVVDREVEEAFDVVVRYDTRVDEIVIDEMDGDITWRWER